MWIKYYTEVDGTERTGLYAEDGSYNVVDSAAEEGFVGIYHPCGGYWVTFVTEKPKRANAPNGSHYIVVPE